MEPVYSFGYWLKLKRKALDLTREGLASQVGCSAATIRKIETEERRPSAQIVERLEHIFNIPESEHNSFLRFARGDGWSVPAREIEVSPWQVTSERVRSNLPAPTTSFIGREDDIAGLRTYLAKGEIRLVSLIGPPGIGKTRLSLEVARQSIPDFSEGVFFISLSSLENSTLVAPTILQALGFLEMKDQSPFERIKECINDQRLLLILDNAEHIIEKIAILSIDLLAACPNLKIIVTSREALHVPGEWIYPITPLDIPTGILLTTTNLEVLSSYAGIMLFAERARAVQPDFTLNSNNIEAVASICTRLDGLPLAIELLAARIRFMTPMVLLAHLSETFTLHADGVRGVPQRQKTLAEAIRWSFNLLSDEEKLLFTNLSVFAGGFNLETVEDFFGDNSSGLTVIQLVNSLYDKSLLQCTFDAQGEPRFSMLTVIRQFATERLHDQGKEALARDKHMAYFLELAEKASREFHGSNQVEWIDRLDLEKVNFHSVLEWCISRGQVEAAIRLLSVLAWPWRIRGYYDEVRSFFNKIQALPETKTYLVPYAGLLNQISLQSWIIGDFLEAKYYLLESQSILLKTGEDGEKQLAEVLTSLGMVTRFVEGNDRRAESLIKRSLSLHKKYKDQRGIAWALLNLGWIADTQRNDGAAISLYEQSLDLSKQDGDLWSIGRVSQFLGQLFLKQGNFEEAYQFFEQHLQIDESLDFKQGMVIALSNLGDLYRHQRNYSRARESYEMSLDLCRELGLKLEENNNLYSLGLVALQQNDYSLARNYITSLTGMARTRSEKNRLYDYLIALAAIAAGMNQPERAAKLSGIAQVILNNSNYQVSPFDQVEFERHISLARKQAGEEKFGAWTAEGCAMSMEQALAYAFGVISSPPYLI